MEQINRKSLKYLKSFVFCLLAFIMLIGCESNHTSGIYNTWICTNRKGPILVINENGPYYQYNKQTNREINYFSGTKADVKSGQDALNEVKKVKPQIISKNVEHFYSVKFYFDKYIDENGKNQSKLIQKGENWWYIFQIVGNGRADVLNMNTGETFFVEV